LIRMRNDHKHDEYTGRRRGYLRCSKEDQKEDRQIDGLLPHCDEMHVEFISAVSPDRPVFDKLIALLQPGDILVVLDIDRAFRSSIDALLIRRTMMMDLSGIHTCSYPKANRRSI
jgi:DNA invertase Pin-like site-specific DNA recombinase